MGENGQNDNTKYNENVETGTSSVKNQQTHQRQQTPTNRFADYFVICGLDLDTGLEPDRFAGTYAHISKKRKKKSFLNHFISAQLDIPVWIK